MPRLLIYEECLAAGTQGPLGDEAKLFLPEGLAMTLAVAEDFARLPGWQVCVMRAPEFRSLTPANVPWRWSEVESGLEDSFKREAGAAQATLVIAPECGGLLQQRAQVVIEAGGTLLGPAPDFIVLTTDKTATVERLAASGIRTPRGECGPLSKLYSASLTYPIVLKPNDGAGTTDTMLLPNAHDLGVLVLLREKPLLLDPHPLIWRAEEFLPGKAASVALLCGPAGPVAMRPASQQIAFDKGESLTYQGGALNLSPAEEARAQQLGLAVARALPPTNGYFGVDLILGAAADGSEDAVIEVNPRLTTSYLGLRHATDQSLAEAMWRIGQGETVNINWLPNIVEFSKQGQVTIRDR